MHLLAIEFHLLLEGPGAGESRSGDLPHHARLVRIRTVHITAADLHAHRQIRRIVVRMSEFRAHEGMAHGHPACRIQGDAAPDAGVAVADGIPEGEIPTHAHEHGGVQADVAVAAVIVFAGRAPGLLAGPAGEIYRIHQHCQRVAAADVRELRDVDVIVPEHAGEGTEQMPVHPELRPVVDALRVQPDPFSGIRFRDVELRAEPVGIVAAAHLVDVRDETFRKAVVVREIRIGEDAVLHQVRKHRGGHPRIHPVRNVVARLGDPLRLPGLVDAAHLPLRALGGVEVDMFLVAGQIGGNCSAECDRCEKQKKGDTFH